MSAATPGRIEFVDLLRGYAVLVMIETHVVNATMASTVTAEKIFQYLTFVNGLVAPSFLFASGFAFAAAARRRIHHYTTFSSGLVKHLSRIALIWVIGYLLHVPVFSLRKILDPSAVVDWQTFFQVDILQCIAATLALLIILLPVAGTEKRLYRIATAAGFMMVAVTPIVWSVDFWLILPWPLAGYMNGVHHSLFPLFPWSGFLLAGAITGYHYLNNVSDERAGNRPIRERSFMRSASWAGGSLILLSIILGPFLIAIYPPHPYWQSNPAFFLLRLGIVLLLTCLLFFSGRGEGTRWRTIVVLFGRESLLVYVLHLLLIYGTFGPFSFREIAGKSFGYAEATGATCALIVLMYLVARTWNSIKLRSPQAQKILNVATLLLVVGMFLFGTG
jgi:uncharacterized membrane protein